MSRVVLDASAILALLRGEPGAEKVQEAISDSLLSTVNLCEVLYICVQKGITLEEARYRLQILPTKLVTFDEQQATIAASLQAATLKQGISFADRACLSLGLSHRLPVLTADKAWRKLKLDVEVLTLR